MNPKSISEIKLKDLTGRSFYPSPSAWEDQVLYFLMLDRFSDGQENQYHDNNGDLVTHGITPPFDKAQPNTVDRELWENQGQGWCGGTLKGLTSKVGYLKRLGVTAVWISPIFKQVSFQETYHGYGPQNYLDIDPNFGTPQELKDLVETAHDHGLYIILDVIINHSGNVFSYDPDRYRIETDGAEFYHARWDGNPYAIAGFNDSTGKPTIPFGPADECAWPDGAVWPREFQASGTFTGKGEIVNWDHYPEYLEGDFSDLKDINLGKGPIDHYLPSPALKNLVECYKYWIAFADLDGFRVDTVKHMDDGASRFFTSAIHEFTQYIGKENFYLIAEITGGRQFAYEKLESVGMDAALGIDDIPDRLEYMVKGYRNPADYFNLFRNSMLIHKESHIWFRNKVVTMFDDHDQVRKGKLKARFCANDNGHLVILNVLALNATTLGIPCIYYGSEQSFNGKSLDERDGSDVFLRECMFGGRFGTFQTQNQHFFNEADPVFQELSKILAIRNDNMALRRGRQYLREISGNGSHFGLPVMFGNEMRSIVPWSRIFNNEEFVLAINTDYHNARSA
ncbi:alpha-amylase family glycosyl hydrolase [Negadavirga shengliensis]|uniref:Alpha-amylase family glycosyl hydrolase n=1 Tax=Negadavirga shengliensis TaxID=1389218 RepID=A0ABV9T632_9BACT